VEAYGYSVTDHFGQTSRDLNLIPFGRTIASFRRGVGTLFYKTPILVLVVILLFDLGFPHISIAPTINSLAYSKNSLLKRTAPTVEAFIFTTENHRPLSQFEREALASTHPGSLKKQLAKKDALASVRRPVYSKTYRPGATFLIVATAYSSTPDQTDGDPCSTANGFNVCKHNKENVIAINGVPFGTKVRFPEYFGDQVFTVVDRMNSRYDSTRVDFWLQTREKAKKFGVKRMKMEVVDEQLASR